MVQHTREENKKYGELYVIEEDPTGWGDGTVITYRNGMTMTYLHSVSTKRQYSSPSVQLLGIWYPSLKGKQSYLCKDADEVCGVNGTRFTGQRFTFDGDEFEIAYCGEVLGIIIPKMTGTIDYKYYRAV